MIFWILLSAVFGIAFYRLGLGDGMSSVRRGRLLGERAPHAEKLLDRIDAYDGRKEPYDR